MSYVTTQDLTAGSTVSQKLTQPETQQRKRLSTWVDLTSVKNHWSSYSSQSQMQVRLLLCQSEHTREFTDLVSGLGKEVTGTNTMIQQLSKFFSCTTIQNTLYMAA